MALADCEVVVVLVRVAGAVLAALTARLRLEVVASPPRLRPGALVVVVAAGAIPPRLSPGAALVVVLDVPSPPRLSPVVVVMVPRLNPVVGAPRLSPGPDDKEDEVVAGVGRPRLAAGAGVEVRPRPVSGVPAVKLPPGLEVRERAAGAAEEEEDADGAARPKLRVPAVLTLAPWHLGFQNPPAAGAGTTAAAGVDVAGASPNPPNAGAEAAAAGGGASEEARPRERVPAPAVAVLGAELGAENPPNPVAAAGAAAA